MARQQTSNVIFETAIGWGQVLSFGGQGILPQLISIGTNAPAANTVFDLYGYLDPETDPLSPNRALLAIDWRSGAPGLSPDVSGWPILQFVVKEVEPGEDALILGSGPACDLPNAAQSREIGAVGAWMAYALRCEGATSRVMLDKDATELDAVEVWGGESFDATDGSTYRLLGVLHGGGASLVVATNYVIARTIKRPHATKLFAQGISITPNTPSGGGGGGGPDEPT